jgi:glycogen debranching enzyme
LNDCFFEEKLDKKKKFEIFEENLMKLEMDYNLLGIVDIVLNHTSTNSQWLYDNPDSAYNLVNSPHLTSAFILDDVLIYFIYSK